MFEFHKFSCHSYKTFSENEFVVEMSPSLVISRPVFSTESFCTEEAFKTLEPTPNANPLERTEAWLAEDVDMKPYPQHDMDYEDISSGDTDHSSSKIRQKHNKSMKKHKTSNKNMRDTIVAQTVSKTSCKYKIKREFRKNSKTRFENTARKRSNNTNIVHNSEGVYLATEYDKCVVGAKRIDTVNPISNVAASKPASYLITKLGIDIYNSVRIFLLIVVFFILLDSRKFNSAM